MTRSQNAFEESLLRLPVWMLPGGVKVVLLADRGFGRAELAKTCLELRIRYLNRIKPDVYVNHPRWTGRSDDYPIKKGCWPGAEYRSNKVVTLSVVIRWKRGLPAHRAVVPDDRPGRERGGVDRPVREADGGGDLPSTLHLKRALWSGS